MMSAPLMMVIGLLTTWRITHLFNAEDGPGQLLARFRNLFGNSILGSAMDCFFCLSVWTAIPIAFLIGTTWPDRLWLWPTFSGGACLLQRFSEKPAPPPLYYEEEEPI